ncbi:MAG TPA: hypothetical protein VFB30_14285, partial [Spirochaetia bacterium]|nr:hypothetical protein [Spirochaetia bacterium]
MAEAGLALFVSLPTIRHDSVGNEDAPPTNTVREGRQGCPNGLLATGASNTAPAIPLFPWPGFVDGERPPVDLLAVQ